MAMNLRELFDGFKKYVDSMDDSAIIESIRDAVEHTSNSAFLDGEMESMKRGCIESSTQEMCTSYVSANRYAFCSAEINCSQTSYTLSETGGIAA